MFSIHFNSRFKSRRNKKIFAKNIKNLPFIKKYNWKGTNFPLGKDDWKKFEKNNPTLMCYMLKKMTIYPAYISKHNLNHEKQIILLMISNKKQ